MIPQGSITQQGSLLRDNVGKMVFCLTKSNNKIKYIIEYLLLIYRDNFYLSPGKYFVRAQTQKWLKAQGSRF